MKKFFFLLAGIACSLLSYGQANQVVWNNGRVQFGMPIVSVDSLTFPDVLLESDTMFFILPRSMKHIVHDTVTVVKHDTVTVTNTVTIVKHDTIYIHDGENDDALKGAFSVSADKQVVFSRGNLQYTQSTKKWGFAENQYDVIGVDNVTGGTASYDATYGYSNSGTALADTIDLFGWSANNTTAQWGISTSTTTSDYSGDFVDWGKNIGDGNTWRTLSKDEWYYLFSTRTDASSKYGVARINLNDDGSQYMNGLIVLPDTWTCPSGITFKSGVADSYGVQYYADYQTFTLSQWQQLEQAGAVFLPAAGYRTGTSVYNVQYYGYYWSSPADDAVSAWRVGFSGNYVNPQGYGYRGRGQAVRLAQDL